MKKILVFILFIIPSVSMANDKDIRLDKLFYELKNLNSKSTSEIEQQIWKIWSTHPTNKELTVKLEEGSSLVRVNEFLKAIEIFTEVIDKDPNWAEAWNKRATVLYLIGDYQASQNDINKVLSLEKRHFGALAGQGLVNIKLKNYEKAIKSYKQALEIHPYMKSPEIMIQQIEELIKEELI